MLPLIALFALLGVGYAVSQGKSEGGPGSLRITPEEWDLLENAYFGAPDWTKMQFRMAVLSFDFNTLAAVLTTLGNFEGPDADKVHELVDASEPLGDVYRVLRPGESARLRECVQLSDPNECFMNLADAFEAEGATHAALVAEFAAQA